MVKCLRCEFICDEYDLNKKYSYLDDDAWGAGRSHITEYYCPNCGFDEFEDGCIYKLCGEFIADGEFHRCEGWENTEDS